MTCPKCSAAVDLDEEDLDEGDPVSCDECGAELRVASTNPVELVIADEEEADEDLDEDAEDEEDEDEDFEEEEEEDEWS